MKRKRIYSFAAISLVIVATICVMITYRIVKEDKDNQVAMAANVDLSSCTESNPLTVIEVVPYILYAEFGNHISGGELVDYDYMVECQENDTAPNDIGPVYGMTGESTAYTSVVVEDRELFAMYSKEYFKRYSLGLDDVDEDLLKKQAIRKRLTKATQDSSEDSEFKKACQNLLDTTYKYTTEEEKALKAFNAVVVKYKAVLFSEVNSNPSILNDADLILITGISSSTAVYQLRPYLKDEYKEKLLKYNEMTDEEWLSTNMNSYESNMVLNPFYYDEAQRMTWKSADHIFNLSAKIGGTPVIMHNSVVRSSLDEYKTIDINKTYLDEATGERTMLSEVNSLQPTSNNNVYKLYLMLYQKGAIAFKEDYDRYINDQGEYTLQQGDAKSYWGLRTFVDYDKDGNEIEKKGDYLTSYNNILIGNGFTYNNDASPNYMYTDKGNMDISVNDETLNEDGYYIKDTFKYEEGVVDYFEEGTTSISIADAIKYLLIGNTTTASYEKTSLHILDLEPSNEFTLTNEKLKEYFPNYNGEFVIDYMTSQEFNSKRSDLAGQYDLLYLGANTGGLSDTHNDSSYDGMIYMHTGDSIHIKKSNKEVTEYYSGNDISTEKEKELIAYCEAGLPVIVADDLLIETKMDTASTMYEFLDTYTNDTTYVSQFVTESQASLKPATTEARLISYLNHKRPDFTVENISYTKEQCSVSVTVNNLDTENSEEATAILYADLDGDGIIEDTALTTKTIKDTSKTTLSYKDEALTDANNAIVYKVVVELNEQTDCYQTVFGTITRKNTSSRNGRILQIMPDDTTVELSSKTDLVGEKINELTEYNLEVSTITVSEFESLYDSKAGNTPYDKANQLTDQFINYDVVVLGCSNDYPVINNENGALDNLIAFINRGKSVVFTYSVLSPRDSYKNTKTKEAYETLRSLAGMDRYSKDQAYKLNDKGQTVSTDGDTYYYLNKYKTAADVTSMFNYSGTTLNKESDYETTTATKVNDGAVLVYPYEISFDKATQQKTSDGEARGFESLNIAKTTASTYQLAYSKVTGYVSIFDTDTAGRGLYSTSPNDIENNYYLYNCNNVWYSGIGATTLQSEEQEAELFVNTLVNACMQAGESPTVRFLDVHTDSSGTNIAFVDTDVYDTTVTSNKTLSFIPTDPLEGEEGINTTVYIVADGTYHKLSSVTKKEDGKTLALNSQTLTSGETYQFEVDKAYINANDVYAYVIVETEHGIGAAKCELKRRNDFSLD